jgi:integrase
VGLDPVTGKRRYATTTVTAASRRGALSAAKRWEAQVLTKARGTNALTFGEHLDEWWADRRPRLAPGTVMSYAAAMKHVEPLRSIPLDRLSARQLDRLYVRLADDGLSAASIRKIHYIVSGALRQAKRHRLVGENVAVDAEPPALVRADVRPPTVEELAAILTAADDEQFHAFLFAAATTGARRGELCALQWRDVDLPGGTLTIRANLAEDGQGVYRKDTKSHRARTVALDTETLRVLSAHHSRCSEAALSVGSRLDGQRYVFSPRPGNDQPYTPKVITRRVSRLLERLGFSGLRLHDLRHFVGSQLIAGGADPETVRQRLGHSRSSTTLGIYTHAVAGNHAREAADLIGGVVARAATATAGGQREVRRAGRRERAAP